MIHFCDCISSIYIMTTTSILIHERSMHEGAQCTMHLPVYSVNSVPYSFMGPTINHWPIEDVSFLVVLVEFTVLPFTECTALVQPTNGKISCNPSTTAEGTTCTITCNAGFALVDGDVSQTCTAGAWSGNTPRCLGTTINVFPYITYFFGRLDNFL